MGCLSSKICTRSRSFRDELRGSLHRRINGFPELEDIIISKNGGDQILALVCTANTVAKKLQNGIPEVESNNTNDKQTDLETINSWELMADIEEVQGLEKISNLQPDKDKMAPASTSFGGPLELDALKDIVHIADGEDQAHYTSIHTVDEYDALVGTSNRWSRLEEGIVKDPSAGRSTIIDQRDRSSGDSTFEKGYRRKAMAKELTSLSIPTTVVDFPATGSLGDWTELRGQMFSSDDYVTPKFGKFCSTNNVNGEDCVLFDPEMVASFEEAMKQLTEEEECILQQIVERQEEESLTEENEKREISNSDKIQE